MKRKALIIITIAVSVIAGIYFYQSYLGTVATVNGEKLTQREFSRRFNKMKAIYELQGTDFSSKVTQKLIPGIKKQILEDIIKEKVLLQEAQRQGITVQDSEVNQQLAKLKSSFASPEDFQRSVKSQNITVDDVQQYLRTQMIINSLQKKMAAGVKVSVEEARQDFARNPRKYQQVELSSILLADEIEAKKVIQALLRGEDFGQLAVEKSIEPGVAETRGYLGWVFRSQMVPQVEAASLALKDGQFSGKPVRTQAGYAVILVKDKKDTLAELENDVIHALKEQKKQEAFDIFTEKLLKQARIAKKQNI